MINMAYRPYCSNGLNSLQSFSLIAQFMTLFVGIMILLTKATTVSEEDGGSVANKTEATVVAFLVTILNAATMVWPIFRKVLSGDYQTYVQMAKIVFYKWPVKAYNKVFGVGGWCGQRKSARSEICADFIILGCASSWIHTWTHA